MIAFGPIPSRRLGQSLGINHIPPKVCSFNCVYCQVGPTTEKTIRRQAFYDPAAVIQAVRQRVAETRATGGTIDYLTFVPDGEPTLDMHLGEMILQLQDLNIKIAVFTNSTLLWREDVRAELNHADYVSVKVDAVDEATWYKINRPAAELSLPQVLEGIQTFCQTFPGQLVTETMVVRDLNDQRPGLEATAKFLAPLQPSIAYLALPTRPPHHSWVASPTEQNVTEAYQLFSKYLEKVECLTGFSPDAFSVSGDVVQELLSIMAVHPMRESEVLASLERGGIRRSRLEELVADEALVRVFHEGQTFYLRKLALKEAEA